MDGEIKLGLRVKDKVTGFTGIATSRCEYLYGTTQIYVESLKPDENEPVAKWFDISRIVLE